MTLTTTTVAGLSTAYADAQAGDLLPVERAGVMGRQTRAQFEAGLGLSAVAKDTVVPVVRGGTGATDAAGARTALGATPTGAALFTAADAAAGRAAIGAASAASLGTMASQAANNVNITGGTASLGGLTVLGNAFLESNSPFLTLSEADGASTHRRSVLTQDGNSFQIQTRNGSGDFVAQDYAIAKGASGATSHSWLVANGRAFTIDRTTFGGTVYRLLPGDTNTIIGSSVERFVDIFLVNAPNVSSDARLKENIRDLNEAERAAAAKIKVRTFTMKDTGQRKIGYIAQEIIEAMQSEGLCAFEYGLVTDGDTYGVDYDAVTAFRAG